MMGVLLELIRQKTVDEPIVIMSPKKRENRQQSLVGSPEIKVRFGNKIMRRNTSHKMGTEHTPAPHKYIRCYNCGETGHVQRNCWHQQMLKCNVCGGKGHKSNSCWYA